MELTRGLARSLWGWFDSGATPNFEGDGKRIDWLRVTPFVAMHLACLAVFWVGVSATALAVAAGLFALRMFAITGFYHRYFSHRSFRTSRAAQFVFALVGTTAAQRGPLWWASHHRHHHAHADQPEDAHSARRHGFAWSHAGWFLAPANFRTRSERVLDFARFPELQFLDRFDIAAPILLGAAMLWLGGLQLFVWGFCVSTVALYHTTFTINSLAHRFGSQRYATPDDSRNNFWLALITFGEGWHNNHHHYPRAARQGFYWWEVDLTWYGLRLLAALGLIWDLRPVPVEVREARASCK
jgi:stearoyl-CoA desaturase (delta-9 desaturase)